MFILGRERKGVRGLFPKIRNLKTNRKFKDVKILKQVEGLEIFVKISKLIFKIFTFIFLPIFLILVIILAVVFAVWHWFNPTNGDLLHISNFLNYDNLNINNDLQSKNLIGGFVESVLEAVCAVLYVIFISPILWVLSSFQVIIVYMASGGLLTEFLFGNNSTFLNVPKPFIIVSGIAIGLMTLFFTLKMFEIMNAKHNIKAIKLKSGVTNILFALIGVVFIPIMFIILNTLIIGITKIIAESGNLSTTDLGLTVFNSSFTDKIQDFKEVPKWIGFKDSANFSYLICIIAELFVCYSMFLIGIMLIWNAFELLILFCMSPLPIAWCIEDEGKRFRAWKEVTIARFINIAIIFLTYTIFIASLGVFAKISNNMPTTASRPVFILLGLFAGVTAVIKAPSMLAGVLGNHNMALSEGLSTIIGMKAVTGGIKTVGGTLLLGSKKKRLVMSRSLGEKANIVNTAGGIVGASRIVKHGYSAIKNHDEKLKSTALATGALVGAFTGTITGGTSLALKFHNHIEKNRNVKFDNEKLQRQENIKDNLIDNIQKSANKLKNINNNEDNNKKSKVKDINGK
ncbi:MAG: hypothetical protein H9Q66_01725 [Spiroplasma ixodetis]|nr:hypothetical protein [Spiroplasma ixodetis]